MFGSQVFDRGYVSNLTDTGPASEDTHGKFAHLSATFTPQWTTRNALFRTDPRVILYRSGKIVDHRVSSLFSYDVLYFVVPR